MELIAAQIRTIVEKGRQENVSAIGPIARPIPVEQRRAIGDVLDRWRLNQGWNPWDNDTQDMAIQSFVRSLDRKNIPYTEYGELYERGLQRRADAIRAGCFVPPFSVELMIAEWDEQIRLQEQGRILEEIRKEEQLRLRDETRKRAERAKRGCTGCKNCSGGLREVIRDGVKGYTVCMSDVEEEGLCRS